MDSVDRMYRHLVRTIRARFPQYLSQPFDVASLQQTILPYRLHRRELGLETNEDYEITLTALLSGARGYLIVDERMKDALEAELAAVNPDPSAFKQFGPAMVALSPNALRSLEAGPDDPSTPLKPIVAQEAPSEKRHVIAQATPAVVQPTASPATSAPAATRKSGETAAEIPGRHSTPTTTPSGTRAIVPQADEHCRSCDGLLPAGRPITFCPHCGQNVTTLHCPACGSELEVGWRFCPVCGRPADAH